MGDVTINNHAKSLPSLFSFLLCFFNLNRIFLMASKQASVFPEKVKSTYIKTLIKTICISFVKITLLLEAMNKHWTYRSTCWKSVPNRDGIQEAGQVGNIQGAIIPHTQINTVYLGKKEFASVHWMGWFLPVSRLDKNKIQVGSFKLGVLLGQELNQSEILKNSTSKSDKSKSLWLWIKLHRPSVQSGRECVNTQMKETWTSFQGLDRELQSSLQY